MVGSGEDTSGRRRQRPDAVASASGLSNSFSELRSVRALERVRDEKLKLVAEEGLSISGLLAAKLHEFVCQRKEYDRSRRPLSRA